MIVNILILFFILLLFNQIFFVSSQFTPILEGITSSTSTQNQDMLKLEQKNAGTIGVLKQQLGTLSGLDKQINNLNTNLGSLTNKVIELSQTQNINKQLNSES
jgi:hypothetical protein